MEAFDKIFIYTYFYFILSNKLFILSMKFF